MAHFDVFNGDADGLCALHQLRLADPRDATLVTGVKRDIALLERVAARPGDSVTVLDVSLETNRAALLALLERGATVQYFDHHSCGPIPRHANLHAVIDAMPNVCTGMLVDRYLGGIHRAWAVVAAFGDNMAQAAQELAITLTLRAEQLSALQELGECLNYNAYGDSEADLIVHPAHLYHLLHRHADPFSFLHAEPVLQRLRAQREHDLELAGAIPPHAVLSSGRIVVLPDAAWGRRVRGAYGNFLANARPEEASAVLTPNRLGGYTVSVRAPLSTMRGAAQLCERFATGGGREAAAGINHLPAEKMQAFLQSFSQTFDTA
ncbi:acetyltransferase [Noviherbaspirillum pedocola]|uniref:Acetyltransferase n=1 Tax=Noviherbaspirillum pedocola TaxID=2801341 RepID=A0A934T1T9_9BURK|nr:acetyltransferase [Noviherbaspirillum pedocola]MBK4737582.1 acetyltransferase [Noviherbaspirillum pedocola]